MKEKKQQKNAVAMKMKVWKMPKFLSRLTIFSIIFL